MSTQEQICRQCNKKKSGRFCNHCNQNTSTKYSVSLEATAVAKVTMSYADIHDRQPAWSRKYEELNRCLTRIQKLYNGTIIGGDGEDSLQSPKDYARNFFRVSYELKEMLKEDPNIHIPSNEIEKFCKQDPWVGLSIDIANQTKHGVWRIFFNRRKTKKTIGQINTQVNLLSPDCKDRTELTIEIDGKKEDCLKMAKEILFAWQQFLQTKRLKK